MSGGSLLLRTGLGELQVFSWGITGRWTGGNFGGRSGLVVLFTVSRLVRIIRNLLIHCSGTLCNPICLGMYIVQPCLSSVLKSS